MLSEDQERRIPLLFSDDGTPETLRLRNFDSRVNNKVGMYIPMDIMRVKHVIGRHPSVKLSAKLTKFIEQADIIKAGLHYICIPAPETLDDDSIPKPVDGEDFLRWDDDSYNVGVSKTLAHLRQSDHGIDKINDVASAFVLLKNPIEFPTDKDVAVFENKQDRDYLMTCIDSLQFYIRAFQAGHPLMIDEIQKQAMAMAEKSWNRKALDKPEQKKLPNIGNL